MDTSRRGTPIDCKTGLEVDQLDLVTNLPFVTTPDVHFETRVDVGYIVLQISKAALGDVYLDALEIAHSISGMQLM